MMKPGPSDDRPRHHHHRPKSKTKAQEEETSLFRKQEQPPDPHPRRPEGTAPASLQVKGPKSTADLGDESHTFRERNKSQHHHRHHRHKSTHSRLHESRSRKDHRTMSSSFKAGELSREQAAIIIQSAFRGYRVRKKLATELNKRRKTMPLRKTHSVSSDGVSRQLSHSPKAVNRRIMEMFSPSKNRIAREHMNELSTTALAPYPKTYTGDMSLFLSERETVIVFGGIDPHNPYGVGRNIGKDIYRYIPDTNLWEYVGDMPEPRHQHCVQFLKGRVYLVGGSDPRDDDLRGKNVVCDTCWSFEPVSRSWFSEGSLLTGRKHFGLVVCNQSMYALGGQDRYGNILNSVEKFNPLTSHWELQASMRFPRTGLACSKYRNYIWVAGGLTEKAKFPLTDVVESYDLKTEQWSEVTRLLFPRCHSKMFVMSDRLYIIGGAGRITEKDRTTVSVSAIDMWDPNYVEWRHVTDMTIPRHGHAVAYLGTQLLIIGGVTTIYMRALSNAECFCTQRGTWVRGLACLPICVSGHAAVTLPPAILMTT